MNSEQDRPVDKMSYEKPAAVDLGPAAPTVGGSCVGGDQYEVNGICLFLGNHAGGGCGAAGHAPSGDCTRGESADHNCGTGTDAIASCLNGEGYVPV